MAKVLAGHLDDPHHLELVRSGSPDQVDPLGLLP